MNWKFSILLAAFLQIGTMCVAQQRLVLNNNVYVNIGGNTYLTIDNSSSNALSISGSGGNIVSEGEQSCVQWMIGQSTGLYRIPFTTSLGVKIPFQVNVTSAGSGGKSPALVLSTWETANDNNAPFPTGITNLNLAVIGGDASLRAVDRFWRVDAASYVNKPGASLDFGYDDGSNEMGGSNTINEAGLHAYRWHSGTNTWDGFSGGTANTVANTVNGVVVPSIELYPFWTLIDAHTPVGIRTQNEVELSMWPNPASAYDGVNFEWSGVSTAQIRIHNAVGQVVREFEIHSRKPIRIEQGILSPGTYLVYLNPLGGTSKVKKLVIR